ncbi:MAG: NADH-quinone oxidoreductase subunit L [Actinobacteria bacterium]|nr:NADH-quinone oxidoreductase subunit L [Actinomycetota bacterium]
MTAAAWVCLLAPLAGALLVTLLGTRLSRDGAGYVATASVAVAFGAAVFSFFSLLGRDPEDRAARSDAWTWLSVGDLDVSLGILVDPLSVLMMLIVTGVGALIVAYSIGYMHGDDEERRFFAYMAFFVFSMLLLVESGNFLILLVGWGLVGLSSYLLIGFHHERPSAIAAAKKAFIMNAAGDAAMALALFLLIVNTGALDYGGVFGQVEQLASGEWVVNLVALGLLAGAVAKSAQIPLHTWLPDAMEGPTPVSALIHAATMVTAGVFLLVRCHPIFEAAPRIQDLAAGIGAVTLLVAGLIALVQTDIKRVIAYSTMSQIGYMFLGAGLGAYANGMFHLMTHAFFKALLFLAAGIVIHALLGEQDMRKMGGLRRLLPRTWLFFLIGGLALAGMPPLSGFFSKDSVLASALDAGTYGQILWVAGLIGALLTGIYTFRMIFMVFGGEPSAFVQEHLHKEGDAEGPFWMTSTVAVLALLAVVGGWIQIAGLWHPLASFLDPILAVEREHLALREPSGWEDLLTSVLAVGLGLVGIWLAWRIYGVRRTEAPAGAGLRRVLEQKFFFDEVYDAVFYRPAAGIARMWTRWIEAPLIGGSLRGLAAGTRDAGGRVTQVQTGFLRNYALAIAAGLAVLAVVFLSVRA